MRGYVSAMQHAMSNTPGRDKDTDMAIDSGALEF